MNPLWILVALLLEEERRTKEPFDGGACLIGCGCLIALAVLLFIALAGVSGCLVYMTALPKPEVLTPAQALAQAKASPYQLHRRLRRCAVDGLDARHWLIQAAASEAFCA